MMLSPLSIIASRVVEADEEDEEKLLRLFECRKCDCRTSVTLPESKFPQVLYCPVCFSREGLSS